VHTAALPHIHPRACGHGQTGNDDTYYNLISAFHEAKGDANSECKCNGNLWTAQILPHLFKDDPRKGSEPL
jgi:hypothetical protein